MRIRPISISLSPNVERDDLLAALRLLVSPWAWTKGFRKNPAEDLENEFARKLGFRFVASFNAGRSALLVALRCLELREGQGVFLQAFTCNAVSNPISRAGLLPVFVDCRAEDYNMDPEDLAKKIDAFSAKGKKPGAVIIQHTFGIPGPIEEIREICRSRGLALIEDCAHSLGASLNGKPTGVFGDIAIFSFSRDKAISCVYGGMVATNDSVLGERLLRFRDKLGYPSPLWTLQQIAHPVLLGLIILPAYRVFGKYLLVLFQHLRVLSKAVSQAEKRGVLPGAFPRRLPRALAILATLQLSKLDRFTAHRKRLALFYRKSLEKTSFILPEISAGATSSFLRFPVRHLDAHHLIKAGRKRGILLGDWYTSPVDPGDTVLSSVGYEQGSCPVAESIAGGVINLPTCVTVGPNEAEEIISFLRSYEK